MVGSADEITFGIDYGSDMGSSYEYFDYYNYGKPVDSFLDNNLNTMMKLYLIYLRLADTLILGLE